MKLALSILCENPVRPTGLTTLYRALVSRSLERFADVEWLVYAGPNQDWAVSDPRVKVVRDFPANDRLVARLWADHWRVGPHAAAHGASALVTTGFVPWRAPLPVAMQVVTLHHLEGRTGGVWRNAYRARALRSGVRRSILVIANSDYTAGRLVRECGAERARVLVSPEGVDHGRFHTGPVAEESLPAEWNVEPGYLLWVSAFYPYKHAERLLAAYARLPESLRLRHPLVFAGGEWDGGRKRAQAAAQTLGLDRAVRFLGRVDDARLPLLYRHAALHALPSTEETFGRTVLEAMACGCPCVVQDIPAVAEVLADAGVRVDFAAAGAAMEALQRVLTEPDLAADLRARGLQRAQDFSFTRLVDERVDALRARCR